MTIAQMFHAIAPTKRTMRVDQVPAFEGRVQRLREQWIANRRGE